MTAVLRPAPERRILRDRRGSADAGTRTTTLPAFGAMGALAVFGFFLALLAMAAFHTVLVSGQFEFDNLQGRLQDGREQEQVLREEVARLESPQRILLAAQGRLGMVVPPHRPYLWSVIPGDPLQPLPVPAGNPFVGTTR